MIKIAEDILSLTGFKRNTNLLLRRLKQNGRPIALTINGSAQMVVQDACAYQSLLDKIEELQQRIDARP